MRKLKGLFFLISALLISSCGTENRSASGLEGVWRVTRIVNLDAGEEADPGNMHYVITKGHIMTVGGKEERPVIEKNFADMSPDEIKSQLPAGGGFMSYKILDGKIHRTTKFALSELFEGKLIVTEFEVDENSLVFRDDHSADRQLREWHMVRVE